MREKNNTLNNQVPKWINFNSDFWKYNIINKNTQTHKATTFHHNHEKCLREFDFRLKLKQ